MICSEKVHVGRSSCLLCRQVSSAGSYILDLRNNLLTVPECKSPCAGCSYSPYPRIWFHATCYDVLLDSFEPSEKPTSDELERFANATSPFYKPQREESKESLTALEGLFSKYARGIIQESFSQDLLKKLPVEVQIIISEFIGPCWYLTVLGETNRLIRLLRTSSESQCTQLSLTREIWMSRIRYRGISYLARLSNKPLGSNGVSGQYCIKPTSNIKRIVMAADCIGLRGIQFMDHDSVPSPDGSPWYEILEAGRSCLEANVEFNGLFVRGVRLVSDDSSPIFRIWSSPSPPKFHPWNFFHVRDNPRLTYVKFSALVQGLLVCCADGKTVGIHGFSGTSKAFRDFVDLMHQRTSKSHRQWIYFPFNENEYIRAAWVRKFKFISGLASNPILLLQTSTGRTVTFGPQYPGQIADQYEYHPLVTNGDSAISGIFHDGLDPTSTSISALGVTCSGRDCAEAGPMPTGAHFEPPPVPSGRGSRSSAWYMTKASLSNLVKVKVCRDKTKPHNPCLGMLLFYGDRHIESIGQICWQHGLTEEILKPMYVEIGYIDERGYIRNIRSDLDDPELVLQTGEWQRLPNHGTIVWWFGRFGDRIITYDD
ncbi:hypothetical protein DTO282E5_4510 [Paecilomyces variotii]|nr:hypothetical protein DTO282E5_4510 [Paecilomyces variotii]